MGSWVTRMRTFFLTDRWKSQTQNDKLPHHVRCSFPQELFSKIETSIGTRAALDICDVLNESPMTFLRVNTAKISRDKVYTFLSSRGVPVEKTLNSKVGLLMTSKQKMLELPEYKLGYFEIQDESSQLISRQVDAKRRLRKAGIQNYMLLPPSHPLLPKLRMKMDWVLVDAP